MVCEFNEPWIYSGSSTVTVRDRFDDLICRMHWPNATTKGTFEVDEAKAYRMIAAVNACVGIPQHALEQDIVSDLWTLAIYSQLQAFGLDNSAEIADTLKTISEKMKKKAGKND